MDASHQVLDGGGDGDAVGAFIAIDADGHLINIFTHDALDGVVFGGDGFTILTAQGDTEVKPSGVIVVLLGGHLIAGAAKGVVTFIKLKNLGIFHAG